MESTKLTPGQCAQLLGISTRTLRRWASAFGESLSLSARRRGRKRAFTGADVTTLQRASRLLDEGLPLVEVAKRLPAVSGDEPVTSLVLATEEAILLGTLSERTSHLSDSAVEHSDRLDRLEKWANQSWWRKIFSTPTD